MGRSVRNRQRSVLLVEDDYALRFGIAGGLRMRGYDVLESASVEDAVAQFMRSRPDVVLSDLFLTDGEAFDLILRVRALDSAVPIFIITGQGSIGLAVRAMKEGANDVLTKPVSERAVHDLIQSTMGTSANSRESGTRIRPVTLNQTLASPQMQKLEEQIERLRRADCPVLILGETGTGKSMLARRIHEVGARAAGPLVEVNCAGLSRELFESELFGHERGAFTGAHAPKPGLLDAANEGSLFLDEIGDIDAAVQPKLLKVLEEGRFRRLGDTRERTADVRLIAATHHDLLTGVRERTFRADLYYRISTVTLHVPPLRERPGDIVQIAKAIGKRTDRDIELSRDAIAKLSSYAWPGNIRELKNVIERAMLLGGGDVVTAEDLVFDSSSSVDWNMERPPSRLLAADASDATRMEVEREHIRLALDAEKGRVEAAARRLGIPRSTLYWKLKKLNIQR